MAYSDMFPNHGRHRSIPWSREDAGSSRRCASELQCGVQPFRLRPRNVLPARSRKSVGHVTCNRRVQSTSEDQEEWTCHVRTIVHTVLVTHTSTGHFPQQHGGGAWLHLTHKYCVGAVLNMATTPHVYTRPTCMRPSSNDQRSEAPM